MQTNEYMKSLITIIVPVYNVSLYIRKSLDSIVSQTYTNTEILLIDDGSTDDSGKICDEYALRFSNIRVYHKNNEGVSSARNLGIKEAKGDYLTFIDSDDVVEQDMIDIMYDNAQKYNTLLSCCKIDIYEQNGLKRIIETGKTGLFGKEEILQGFYVDQHIKNQMYGPYNKLFHKSIVRNVAFKPYKLGEDILFVFEVLQNCESVYIADYVGYHYLQRPGSAVTTTFGIKRLDYIYAGEEMLNICKRSCPNIQIALEKWLFTNVVVIMREINIAGLRNDVNIFYEEHFKYLINNKRMFFSLSMMRKIDYLGVVFFPFYFRVLNCILHLRSYNKTWS